MVPNLKSARHAIESELSHARQGIAYYTARVEALEIALHQLENVEDIGEAAPSSVKPKGNLGGRKMGAGRRGRKPRGATNGAAVAASAEAPSRQRHKRAKRGTSAQTAREHNGSALPTTGADFWLNLVTDEPRSAVEISNAAIESLGIKPDQKTEIQKLKQRVSPALANLLAAQRIKDSGAGRERRFFKEG